MGEVGAVNGCNKYDQEIEENIFTKNLNKNIFNGETGVIIMPKRNADGDIFFAIGTVFPPKRDHKLDEELMKATIALNIALVQINMVAFREQLMVGLAQKLSAVNQKLVAEIVSGSIAISSGLMQAANGGIQMVQGVTTAIVGTVKLVSAIVSVFGAAAAPAKGPDATTAGASGNINTGTTQAGGATGTTPAGGATGTTPAGGSTGNQAADTKVIDQKTQQVDLNAKGDGKGDIKADAKGDGKGDIKADVKVAGEKTAKSKSDDFYEKKKNSETFRDTATAIGALADALGSINKFCEGVSQMASGVIKATEGGAQIGTKSAVAHSETEMAIAEVLMKQSDEWLTRVKNLISVVLKVLDVYAAIKQSELEAQKGITNAI